MPIDLDAARAARKEAAGEGPKVVFKGKTFELPSELAYSVLEELQSLSKAQSDLKAAEASGDAAKAEEAGFASASAMTHVVRSLLGDAFDPFMAGAPSIEDLEALIDGLLGEYGMSDEEGKQGNTEASATS